MDGRTVWNDTADAGVLRTLEPGVADDIERPRDVVIVGGGVVGLATAVACRRHGVGEVLVLERHRLASGPSGRAGGILAPERHIWTEPEAFVEFARQSLTLTAGSTLGSAARSVWVSSTACSPAWASARRAPGWLHRSRCSRRGGARARTGGGGGSPRAPHP